MPFEELFYGLSWGRRLPLEQDNWGAGFRRQRLVDTSQTLTEPGQAR